MPWEQAGGAALVPMLWPIDKPIRSDGLLPEVIKRESRKGGRTVKRKTVWILAAVFALTAFVFLNNASVIVKPSDAEPFLLAHRGLAQCFPMEGITAVTNTARRIYPPEHPYLENTILSMEAAFRAGADMVEFDVQHTKDGQLAAFHDSALEYRTDGSGPVSERTMAELKTLDVGHGYTADDGKTYPFRGRGIGMMPSLTEVLDRFPDDSFLIHLKNNDPRDGELLAQCLAKEPDNRLAKLAFYGGDKPIAELKRSLPEARVMSMAVTKKALISYMAVGWTGYVPASMRNTFFYLPARYARLLWGWPHRFVQRMRDAGTRFVLVAGDGKWSEGFDRPEDLERLPANYSGGIWTNRIDLIAPLYGGRKENP